MKDWTFQVSADGAEWTTVETGELLDPVVGVTGTEFARSCEFPPASQGADGWVTALPESFGDGRFVVTQLWLGANVPFTLEATATQ